MSNDIYEDMNKLDKFVFEGVGEVEAFSFKSMSTESMCEGINQLMDKFVKEENDPECIEKRVKLHKSQMELAKEMMRAGKYDNMIRFMWDDPGMDTEQLNKIKNGILKI